MGVRGRVLEETASHPPLTPDLSADAWQRHQAENYVWVKKPAELLALLFRDIQGKWPASRATASNWGAPCLLTVLPIGDSGPITGAQNTRCRASAGSKESFHHHGSQRMSYHTKLESGKASCRRFWPPRWSCCR